MQLSERTILITGAGTGMGLVAAKALADRVNQVIMVARDESRLRHEAQKIPHARAFPCDITDPGQVSLLLDWAQTNAPDLDTLFLNAGLTHTYRLFDGTDAAANAREEIEANVVAAVDLTHRFLPLLTPRPDPVMIVTTSGVIYGPDTTNPTYSATKAALHSYIQSMRYRLQQLGSPVRVFEFIAPLVDTPFAADVISDAKERPEDAVAELLAGLERDEPEIRGQSTEALYQAWRQDPDQVTAMVNQATGA